MSLFPFIFPSTSSGGSLDPIAQSDGRTGCVTGTQLGRGGTEHEHFNHLASSSQVQPQPHSPSPPLPSCRRSKSRSKSECSRGRRSYEDNEGNQNRNMGLKRCKSNVIQRIIQKMHTNLSSKPKESLDRYTCPTLSGDRKLYCRDESNSKDLGSLICKTSANDSPPKPQ